MWLVGIAISWDLTSNHIILLLISICLHNHFIEGQALFLHLPLTERGSCLLSPLTDTRILRIFLRKKNWKFFRPKFFSTIVSKTYTQIFWDLLLSAQRSSTHVFFFLVYASFISEQHCPQNICPGPRHRQFHSRHTRLLFRSNIAHKSFALGSSPT